MHGVTSRATLLPIACAQSSTERTGSKAGRGSENKRPHVIAVATDEADYPHQAVIEPVTAFTKATLADWAICRRLAPSAEVYSDGPGGVSGRR